jgi:hypothetical protein
MSNPFDRNPFRLPPPWNAGYALPQNVDDEGLERHAYTTAWAPRGSFDNPKVGDAGYAVPGYVNEEGYGQGAFVTRWAPRGSYAGPRVPHWLDKQSAKITGATRLPGGAAQLQIRALAGIETAKTGEAPFTAYGLTSAAALMETVKMMPPALREKQLRMAMDKIDPKLYSRAGQFASIEAKAGVPADVALERGIALAMSHGIATELVDLGKGKKPPRKSQLGAVCYSCFAALGDMAGPLAVGTCRTDGTSTWIWAKASDGSGYWRRKSASESCLSTTTVAPTTRVCSATNQTGCPGGVYVASTSTGQQVTTKVVAAPPPSPTAAAQKFLNIGPFLIPITVGAWRDHRPLPAEQKAYVDQNIAVAAKAGGVSIAEMKTGKYPFVKFEANGENWGLFYQESDGTQKTSRGTLIPAGTVVAYHKIAPSMLGGIIGDIGGALVDAAEWVGGAIASVFKAIWKGIKWVAAKVVDFVADAAEWIKDKACDLFTSPLGQVAGAAAGAAVGGPAGAQAGAMGAQVAAQACSDPAAAAPAAPMTPPPEGIGLMPLLLIGGAGIAAVMFLGKKRK